MRWQTKYEDCECKVQLPDGEWIHKKDVDMTRYRVGKTIFVKSPIAIVPSEGYVARDNFSKASIQWWEWTVFKENNAQDQRPTITTI